MQEVKLLVRQIGIPNPGLDVISEADLNEYIAYQLTSQGYALQTSHYMGEVKDPANGVTVGYKFGFVFVRSAEAEAKRGPGRPKKEEEAE